MGIAYNPKIVTNGLAMCLDAANQKSYPGTGTTWTDLTRLAPASTLTNGASYSSENQGIVEFDGVDDYVRINNRTMPGTLYPFSYGGWFNVSRVHTVDQALCVVLDTSSSSRYWALGVLSNTNELIVSRRNTTVVTTSLSFTPTTNEWFHAHVNFASTTSLAVYINGSSIFSNSSLTAVASSTAANDVLCGLLRTSSPTWYLQGATAGINLYNRILSEPEIQQNFNALRGRFGI